MTLNDEREAKCGTTSCQATATTRWFLARSRTDMCHRCAERAETIGGALGCYIHTEPLVLRAAVVE